MWLAGTLAAFLKLIMKSFFIAGPGFIFSSPLAILPAAIAVMLSTHVAAQSSPTNDATPALNNMVVTATRTLQDADTALAQISVITRADIEAAGLVNLTELLQRKAGVEIRATGGAGQPSGVFIRGANSQHTLVLVDGLRLGSSTSGAAAFENIPLDLIERIEVVKGPLSGVYGSDAIGGVVQIFTRNTDKPRLSAEVGVGSNSTHLFSAGFTAAENKTSITLNAGYREVNARSASNELAGRYIYNPDRDPYSNANVLLKLSHTLWQGETISATAWQSVGRTQYDAGADNNPSNKQILSGIQLMSENELSPGWKSNIRIGQTTDDICIASSFPGTFKTGQNQAIWLNQFSTVNGSMNAGLEWREEKVASTTGYTNRIRTTSAIFASYLEHRDANQLELTVRRDQEDQFGSRNTGSLSYGFQLTPQTLLYAKGGRAFRAPSFNDLYYPGFSNPLLLPERGEQIEGGVKFSNGRYRASAVYFDHKINDLILYDFATSRPQNIRRARIKGWELNASTRMAGFDFVAALTIQKPVDADSNRQLRSRARQFGNVSVARTWGAWSFSTDITSSSARFDSANEAATTTMSGYALFNSNVRYRVDKTWTVDMSATNLGNRDYVLARGYNQPCRTFFVAIQAVAF